MYNVHVLDHLAVVCAGTAGNGVLSVVGRIRQQILVLIAELPCRVRKTVEPFRFQRYGVQCLLRFGTECVRRVVVIERVDADDVVFVRFDQFQRFFLYPDGIGFFKIIERTSLENVQECGIRLRDDGDFFSLYISSFCAIIILIMRN